MGKTILVADDSKTIQRAVDLTFRTTEFAVVVARDGDEALERLLVHKPDVVLADVTMPKKNGYQLCSAIKNDARTAGIRVLLLGSPFEPIDEGRAREAKADGHLVKPFETQVLIDQIKTLTSAEAQAVAAGAKAAPKPHAVPAPAKAEPELDEAKVRAAGPTLEPPPAPDTWAPAKTEVDMWSLAEPGATQSKDEKPKAPTMVRAVDEVAAAAAGPIAEAASKVSGLPSAELLRIAREVIEQVAWEVVPDLAESIIRAELKRLLSDD